MKSVVELLSLKGRVAVITGGAGHIGLAAGESFAELGAAVVIVDREEGACASRAQDLGARFNVATLPLAIDLARDDAANVIVQRTLERYGRIDVVVNNAAYVGTSGLSGYTVPFDQQTAATWDAALRVNLTAAFLLAQAAAPALAVQGGSIINVGSIYGVTGPVMSLYEGTSLGNPAAYAASKGGLIQLTRYLSTVLAPRVRANAMCPGGIARNQDPTFVARYVARTPLQRMGLEEDLKGAFAFLAGDAAAYVTGQTLMVDGGWTAW
jgi:NAD(P)-dependent dehydrogenase (short-subunit alcohol dehydrogenase family)